MLQLAEHDQRIGDIATAPDLLIVRAQFLVFGGIVVDEVDDIEGGDADAQYASHDRDSTIRHWPPESSGAGRGMAACQGSRTRRKPS